MLTYLMFPWYSWYKIAYTGVHERYIEALTSEAILLTSLIG